MKGVFRCCGIYASGMVLQRNVINCIFGEGATESVLLKYQNHIFNCNPNENGEWKIEFNPGGAGGPFEIVISCGINTIIFDDVLVGEVWLSSGQSNAQLPMERMKYSYPEEFEMTNDSIRMITIPINYSFNGEKYSVENPEWLSANPENLKYLSGTAYFFAKKLQKELGIPVGIINASQGGSPVYSWMNKSSLNKLERKDYLERIENWNIEENIEKKKNQVNSDHQKWDSAIYELDEGSKNKWENPENILKDEKNPQWKQFCIPGDFTELKENGGCVWFKKDFNLSGDDLELTKNKKIKLWFGTIQDADKIWINNVFCGVTYYTYPPRRYDVPETVLKEGKNTIVVRVQKNGIGPVRFYEEKNYCLFSDDVKIHPVAFRNVEVPEQPVENHNGFYLDLSGNWQYRISCITSPRPPEMFFEWEPSALYNSMLAPCFNYAIAGALWYQGESNASEYESYKILLTEMINLWRSKFVYAKKNMPFVLMQLPNWADGYRDEKMQNFGDWAEMREAIRLTAEEDSNSASVCMIDGGEWNDLHPEKKKTGGTRAAMEALRIAYGRKIASSPKLEYCERKDNLFKIRFDCGNSELKAYKVNEERADFKNESHAVFGFEFLDKNGNKIPVEARLLNQSDVEIQVPYGDYDLIELRYLWSNNPWIVNLYSADGLPANPFRIKL